MAKRDQDQDQDKARSFLSRWSQRKQAAEQDAEATAHRDKKVARRAGAAGAPAAEVRDSDRAQRQTDVRDAGGPGEPEGIDLKDLPDIDTMDASSDFTVFLRAGVPKALKRRALRKLWRVDPVLGFIDGLDDYNLDYTDAATVLPNMKTLYQVGKGMILPEDEAAEAAAEAEAAEAAGQQLAADGGEAEAAADQGGLSEPQDGPADSLAAPEAAAPMEGQSAKSQPAEPAPRRRNPGDPLVRTSASTAPSGRRGTTPRPATRSARSRRWGESDG